MRASKRFFQSLMTSSKRKKSRRSVVPINTNNGAEPTLLDMGKDTNDSWDDIDPIKKIHQNCHQLCLKKSITLNNFKDNLLSKDKNNLNLQIIYGKLSSNDKDQKNENKIGSLQNLLKEIKHKEEDKNKFHCPVETCNRVESLHVRPSEATIKDIVDFYIWIQNPPKFTFMGFRRSGNVGSCTFIWPKSSTKRRDSSCPCELRTRKI